jgi:hypothetical protein
MPDVIHDPETDWCACKPQGDVVCDYRLLADKVIELFNPADDDGAEVAVLITAVERVAGFIRAHVGCTCLVSLPDYTCPRCLVLGEQHGKPAQR